MLSKEEIKMFERFQFFDKHRKLPFEKERIDITLSKGNIVKLKELKINISKTIDELVGKFLEKRTDIAH